MVPERILKWGHTSGAFMMVIGQYCLVSFLFAVLLLTVLPCPAICKSWGPVESFAYYFILLLCVPFEFLQYMHHVLLWQCW